MSKENVNGDVDENLLPKNESSVEFQIRTSGSPRKGEPFAAADDVTSLETIAERRMRKNSHYVIYCTTFIMSIGFSIILTGVWPYLKQLDPTASKAYLGWVIAANPIGQMLFSPLLGWWANKAKSTRIAFVITLMLSIVGSAMYALLPLMKNTSGYLIFVSRFIVGLSGANIAICRSYIVASTKLKERTSALAAVAAAQAIGFILGPIIQSAIGFGFHVHKMGEDPTTNKNTIPLLYNGIPWNMYSVVGYVGAILAALNLLLYLPCIFKDFSIPFEWPGNKEEGRPNMARPDYVAISILLFSFFVIGFSFVLLESILVPLTIDLYAYDYKTAVIKVGIGLSVLGAIAFLVFIMVAIVSRKIKNDKMLYLFFGFIPMIIGMLIPFPVGNTYPIIMDCGAPQTNKPFDNFTEKILLSNSSSNSTCNSLGCSYLQKWCYFTPIIEKPQLIVAHIVIVIGYAVSFSLAPPLFSKMLGPRPQGLWMGLLSTIGVSARIIGPLFAVYVYTHFGPRWLFGLLFCIFLSTGILVSCFYKRFAPFSVVGTNINR